MPLSAVGSYIKKHAPSQLKQSKFAVKLFDTIFHSRDGKADASLMKRRYYMTLDRSVLNQVERESPQMLIVVSGSSEEGAVRDLVKQFESNGISALVAELSTVCSSHIDMAAILADPGPLRAALFQLNRICLSAGCNLVLAENSFEEQFSKFLASVSYALNIHFVRVRLGLDIVRSLPQEDANLDTYVALPSDLSEQSLESPDDEFIRGMQFLAGLRSSRNCFILTSRGQAAGMRREWNDIISHLISDCEASDANIIVVEDQRENALNTKTYDRILKSDRAALFPGKIHDAGMRRQLMFSKRTICFGRWIEDVRRGGRGFAGKLLSRSREQLAWLATNGEVIQSANLTIIDQLRSRQTTGAISWDFGKQYGEKLVAGHLTGPLALAQSDASVDVKNGVQRYVAQAFGAPGRVDGANKISRMTSVSNSSAFLQWGASESNRRRNLRRNGKIAGAPFFYIEDGFIRSVTIGLTGSPGLSFLVDDLGPYYDARQWSRIELALASEWEITPDDKKDARSAIDAIRNKRISKYNHAPDRRPIWANSRGHTVLLVDQRVGDQSVPSGLATEHSFRQMVIDAIEKPGEPLVVLKRHPDGTLGGRGSYFSRDILGSLLDNPSVILEDGEVNPYALFDVVDEVYCVTSGMGFEAVIAGKSVKTYGAPFYSGWGLTEDHLQLDWRARRRSLEELFYWAYMARSVYYDPLEQGRTDVPGLCSFIERERDELLAGSQW